MIPTSACKGEERNRAQENCGEAIPAPQAKTPQASPLPSIPSGQDIVDVIDVREESYETFIDIHPAGQERPAWDYRLKSKSLHLQWDMSRPRSNQVATLSRMLKRLDREYRISEANAKLLCGLDYFSYPEYAARLAQYAGADPGWSKRKNELKVVGIPRVRALHDYIVETTRRERFHQELERIFSAVGKRLSLEGVEKCSDARPGTRGEMGQWLAAQKLPGRVALPTGCLMAWFRIEDNGARQKGPRETL